MDQSSDKEFGSALGSTSRSQRLAFVDAFLCWRLPEYGGSNKNSPAPSHAYS